MARNIPLKSMRLRQKWLQAMGGLGGVSVRNKEWLNLLEEDTRQSLMIEGYFVDKRELREILATKNQNSDSAHKVLGYFDAAVFAYEFAFQQHLTREFSLTKAFVRQIHALMFRNDPRFAYIPGEWRKGTITITGAKIHPPLSQHIEGEIDRFITSVNKMKGDVIRKASLTHVAFEQIHPFPDGNGRVGRILMNFILVAHGLPNIAIKGESERERGEYIKALEKADHSVVEVLKGKQTYDRLAHHPFADLEDLMNRTLATALDSIICGRFASKTANRLIPIDQVAAETGKNINSLRVACSQKKIICTKQKNSLVSHPLLLEFPAEQMADE